MAFQTQSVLLQSSEIQLAPTSMFMLLVGGKALATARKGRGSGFRSPACMYVCMSPLSFSLPPYLSFLLLLPLSPSFLSSPCLAYKKRKKEREKINTHLGPYAHRRRCGCWRTARPRWPSPPATRRGTATASGWRWSVRRQTRRRGFPNRLLPRV